MNEKKKMNPLLEHTPHHFRCQVLDRSFAELNTGIRRASARRNASIDYKAIIVCKHSWSLGLAILRFLEPSFSGRATIVIL